MKRAWCGLWALAIIGVATAAQALEADVRGEQLYAAHCASCHEGGVARAPTTSMLGFLPAQSIHAALQGGVMQQQAAHLSPREKVAIAEFISRSDLSSESIQPPQPLCKGVAQHFDWQEPASGSNWGLTLGNSRAVNEQAAALSKADVAKLTLQWAFAFPGAQRVRSHPLIAGGAVFVGSQDGTVYALDAETGCVRWQFQAAAEVRTGFALQTELLADQKTTERRLFFGDLLGRIYALDPETGGELWRLRADDHPAATITGTPTYYAGRLYVPVSSLEVISAGADEYECCHFRGSVVAFDAQDGREIWRTYTITQAATAQGINRTGTQNYGPSGAPIWNSPAIDEKRGQLYVGTGENYSSPATSMSDAILALALDTGELRWVYQATAGDAWNTACSWGNGANCPAEDGPDFDFGAAAVLTMDQRGRDVVLGPQKSGVVHAIDPDTGAGIWRSKLGRGGLHGGVHFGIAESEGRIFVPISDADDGRTYATPANPGLSAVNLADGTTLWQSPQPDQCREREFCERGLGAAITATSTLVFAGALDGFVRIHDASSGAIVRALDTTIEVTTVNGVVAQGGSMDGGSAPVPFGGKLYVTSGYSFAGHMPGNVLLVYGLN